MLASEWTFNKESYSLKLFEHSVSCFWQMQDRSGLFHPKCPKSVSDIHSFYRSSDALFIQSAKDIFS